MSTILKALKRLEDEKHKSAESPLDEQILASNTSGARKNHTVLVAIALIGGMGVGSSALYFWPGDTETEPSTSAPEAITAPSQAGPQTPRQAKPLAEPSPSAGVETAPSAVTAADIEKMQKMMVDALKQRDTNARNASGAAPVSQRPVAESEAKASRQKSAAAREKELARSRTSPERDPTARIAEEQKDAKKNRPARSRRANRSSENTASVEQSEKVAFAEPVREQVAAATPAPIPSEPLQKGTILSLLTSSPDTQLVKRAEVPSVRVKKTTWHPDADRRHAIITFGQDGEPLEMREGDAIGPLVVKSIKPGGILFLHDGVEVRYNVGE